MNEDDSTACQNLGDTPKAVLWRIFRAASGYTKKLKINGLVIYSKDLEKQQQIKCNVSGKKKNFKRGEISKPETKKENNT